MIMRLMRKYFGYWVFAILLVTLSIGLVSGGLSRGGSADAISVINGEPIKYDRFAALVRSAEEDERSRRGRDLSELELANLRRDALDQLVNETLALQGLKSLDLRMSEDEIRQTLLSLPAFKDEKGNYSPARYEEYLKNQVSRGQSVDEVEANIRRSLTLNKAQVFWRNAARVTPAELEQGLRQMHRRAKARLVAWSYASMQGRIKPTDEELHSYYAQNRKRWEKSEQVKARHILIKADALLGTATAKAKADELYKRAKAGENFGKLAKENSQDEGSAKREGDLGYFSRGDMVPEFEAKAFSLKAGEIGEPVLSKFGWHIIKVEGKKAGFEPTYENSKDKVRQGLSEELARKQARQEALNLAKDLSQGKDLAEAAKGLQGGLRETGWFKIDDKAILPGLGDTAPLASALLSLEKGENLASPVSLEKGMAMGALSDEQPGELPKDAAKLAKRRGEVAARLKNEKAAVLYEGWIKSLREKAKITDRFEVFYGGMKK